MALQIPQVTVYNVVLKRPYTQCAHGVAPGRSTTARPVAAVVARSIPALLSHPAEPPIDTVRS